MGSMGLTKKNDKKWWFCTHDLWILLWFDKRHLWALRLAISDTKKTYKMFRGAVLSVCHCMQAGGLCCFRIRYITLWVGLTNGICCSRESVSRLSTFEYPERKPPKKQQLHDDDTSMTERLTFSSKAAQFQSETQRFPAIRCCSIQNVPCFVKHGGLFERIKRDTKLNDPLP